jgi:hypothetical protein
VTHKQRNPLSLDTIFDGIVNESYRRQAPPILYHYTNWVATEGILSKQHFWETAHDCTNDEVELEAAHAVLVAAAKRLQKKYRGTTTRVLYHFLHKYQQLRISRMKTVYMTCFSQARDDAGQWNDYGDSGRGLCLGLRVLNEPAPTPDDTGSALVKVDYSEESWRNTITGCFEDICKELSRVPMTSSNIELGVSALYRIAAFCAMTAKQPKWAHEREFRHITIFRDGVQANPKERTNSEGKKIRYLDDITLRLNGKQLAFAEIIIGQNQDAEQAQKTLLNILEKAHYVPGSPEYPEIVVSTQTLNFAKQPGGIDWHTCHRSE